MKVLLLMSLCCSALARPQSTPAGAILLLPANQSEGQEKTEDEMAQPEGGTYHLYLPDGRLQRVDYNISPPEGAPRSGSGRSLDGGADMNSVYKFFYVKVPADLPTNSTDEGTTTPQDSTMPPAPTPAPTSPTPPTAPPLPPGVFYLWDAVERSGSADRDRSLPSGAAERDRSLPSGAAERDRSQPSQPDLVATVRLSQVQPLSGPVYSLSPSSLVRILRTTASQGSQTTQL